MATLLTSCASKVTYVSDAGALCQGLEVVRVGLACDIVDLRAITAQNLYIEQVCGGYWQDSDVHSAFLDLE